MNPNQLSLERFRLLWMLLGIAFFDLALSLPSQAQEELYVEVNGRVTCLAIQTDGKILAGGIFTEVAGEPRKNLARLNADGSLDESFNPGSDTNVYAIAVQPDGRILVGGAFSVLGGQPVPNLGRLNPDGSVDSSFKPWNGGLVWSVLLQPDGRILAGGECCIRRFNADGTSDTNFAAGPGSGGVWSLALQPDGKILVGGHFTSLEGQPRNRIARLNANGTLDASFDPGADQEVYSLVVQADGSILAGGFFQELAGLPRMRLGRLNVDGTLDPLFNPDPGVLPTNYVNSLAIQADGKLLVGGEFSSIGGEPLQTLARLNPDGTLDTSFQTVSYDEIDALAQQEDGRIVASGLTQPFSAMRGFICRLRNPEFLQQSLSYDGSTITWLRSGTIPELMNASFQYTIDEVNWIDLGAGSRVPGGWQLGGVHFPPGTRLRAQGSVTGGMYNASTWPVETLAVTPARDALGFPAGVANSWAYLNGSGVAWSFVPKIDLRVTEVGYLSGGDAQTNVQVSLWTAEGRRVATYSGFDHYTPCDPNGVSFLGIPTLVLKAGQEYRVALQFGTVPGTCTFQVFGPVQGMRLFQAAPEITFLHTYNFSGTAFTLSPNSTENGRYAFVGPTFRYETAPPRLEISFDGQSVTVNWPDIADYVLETTDRLDASTWHEVVNGIVTSGGCCTLTSEPLDAAPRFYRLRLR